MADEERRKHGTVHLTTRTPKTLEREPNRDLYICPTCDREYLTIKVLNHHRENKEQRKKKWKKREAAQKKMPTPWMPKQVPYRKPAKHTHGEAQRKP